MHVFHSLDELTSPPGDVVLTVGNFDGVHLGHQQLISTARREAGPAGRVAAMTFDPHPLAILAPQRAPARLTTLAERLALLESVGVDLAIAIPVNVAFLDLAADAFLQLLAERIRPQAIIEGPTFNFGRGRAGSIETLREHAAKFGYRAVVVEEVYGRELGGNPPISSSAIRAAIVDGRVEDANAMLGRAYRVAGRVGSGHGRGAALGFPTANLAEIPHLLPKYGVYAAAAQFDSGELHLAAVNIGPQPTFDQQSACVEAHVIDFVGDLRGRQVALHLFGRMREQVRFDGIDTLKSQLARDIAAARAFGRDLSTIRSNPRIAI